MQSTEQWSQKAVLLRRAGALLLSLFALLFCMLPAAAKSSKKKLPLIIVNGMGESPLLLNQGMPEEEIAFPPSQEKILQAVGEAAPYLLTEAAAGDVVGFAEKVGPIARALFEDITFDPDGTPRHEIGQLKFPDSYAEDKTGKIDTLTHGGLARRYGADSAYQFVHDWRKPAREEAANLHAMIQRVLEEQGAQKVKIVAVSMGGAVLTAYLAQYGHAQIDQVIMMSTVFRGLPVVGDLFNGRLTLESRALIRYIGQAMEGSDPWGALLTGLLGAFEKTGLLDWVLANAEALAAAMMPVLNEKFLVPVFGQLPGFWELVPEGDYESAKASLLDPVIHKDLIAINDDFRYNVFDRVPQLIQAARQDGVRVYILSNYNLSSIPVGSHALLQSDDGLATVGTSGGAFCAPLDETLGEGYVQKIADGHNHLSPDGIIDASTCLLPEQTWFTKDLHHVSFTGEDCLAFLLWLLETPGECTVRSNLKYPQFMEYLPESDGLRPLGGGETLHSASETLRAASPAQMPVPFFPATGDYRFFLPILLLFVGAFLCFFVFLRRERVKR
ncbi:MAG: hypothetical protein LBQ33_05170 [Oscillospiraceae bacterium]|jgi:pimeloyl-ACP methyl ester carboxylesterase|nr:hypothetical protein [Oscillospiraceae bacterium]